MACRFQKLLYTGNYFRTNKSAAFYLNSMLFHSSQEHVFNLQWYQNEFPKITKLTHLLANVDAINGRLVDINTNSTIFDDQIEHDMCNFKSVARVFIGSPSVQHKMKHVLASSITGTQHDSFTPFSKPSEREPMVVDSLAKVSNFLSVSAQQRKLVRFIVSPQGLYKGTIMGQQIVHSCLKFLTETAIFSNPDSTSWMKLPPSKKVDSSDSQKWEDVLDMFSDLIKCFRSETRLKLHVAKAEVMKEGLLHIRDVLIDNSIGYKEARHQESLVQKKLSKNLGHSSRCLFTLLLYYLYGRVTDIEVDMCGGIHGNGTDSRFCLFMGRILTADNEKMVGRGVKQLDQALGLFKFIWETTGMKGHLDLQGHMWCVGAENRMLKYRGNMYFMHGICF